MVMSARGETAGPRRPRGGRAGSGPRFGLTQPRAGSELPRQELRPAHAEGPVLEAVLDHRDDQILRAHQIGSRQALGERGIDPLLLLGVAALLGDVDGHHSFAAFGYLAGVLVRSYRVCGR